MASNRTVYARNYMREYRLRARRQGDLNAYRLARRRERDRLRYAKNRPNEIARVRVWDEKHPDNVRERMRRWKARHSRNCPSCRRLMPDPRSTWCRICASRYGYGCEGNPNCGVVGYHKHCPCGTPVLKPKTRRCVVEACGLCQGEMERFGVTLAALFTLVPDEEELAA